MSSCFHVIASSGFGTITVNSIRVNRACSLRALYGHKSRMAFASIMFVVIAKIILIDLSKTETVAYVMSADTRHSFPSDSLQNIH